MDPKLQSLLTSRKFWAAVVGLFLVVLKSFKPDFPLSDAEVQNMVYVLVAYIVGTAIEANVTASRPSLPPPSTIITNYTNPANTPNKN